MKRFFTLSLLVVVSTVQWGCQRSAGDVWEDTKSAGRHLGKGFRTLAGNKQVSRQIDSPYDFEHPCEQDYIPLRDSDISRQLQADGFTPLASRTPGEPGSGLPGIEGFSAPMTAEQLKVFQQINFETDQYSIQGSENLKIIANIAAYMKSHPNLYIFIEGHCDKRGSAAYNLALGNKRANSIRSELIKEGVDPEHLFTISYGKERPLVDGDDADSLRMNRRGEYKIYQYN